jgi:two-component system invasion response regulator UvrY
MTKVLIVDDHAVVRTGIKQILIEIAHFTVEEAKTGRSALDKVANQKFDLVILDISLPDKNGLDVLKEIKINNSTLPVLILSMHSEDQYAVRALKAGAAGYMTKESAGEDLEIAVQKILAGGKFITPSLAEKLAQYLETDNTKMPHETLSDREYQILCLLASGKSLTEIGQDLNLSVKTISSYRTRLLKKMHMKTNAELTQYVMTNNILKSHM